MKRSRPFVRKESLWSRIQTYPFDLFLWANEIISSTPWDDYADSIGAPGGYILSALYIIVSKASGYYSISNKRRANPLFQTNHYDYEKIKVRATTNKYYESAAASSSSAPFFSASNLTYYSGVFSYILSVLKISLFLFSIINAIYLIRANKNYTLLYSSIDTAPKSSSAHKITLTNDDTSSTWDRLVKLLYSRSSRKQRQSGALNGAAHKATDTNDDDDSEIMYSDSDFDETTMDEINLIEKEIWELSVWSPSKFRLALGSTFSPILLIIIYLLGDDLNVWKLFVIGGGISGTFHFIMRKYASLVQDKQILYQEMFEEYNNKFVKPKTSILKKDVCIDATFGPEAPSVLTVKTDTKGHLITGKSKVFITHDINGKAYNNLSVAQRRKITPRGDVTTTTILEGAADTSMHPLANSSYILQDSNNSMRMSQNQQSQAQRPVSSQGFNQQQRQHQPLESPFKSPDKRDHSLYYGHQPQSTPYSRSHVAQPHTIGSRLHHDYPSHYDESRRGSIRDTSNAYDRSFRTSASVTSSPSRSRIDRRAREFQSPKPLVGSLSKTPIPARRPNTNISRSPSPTKRPWQ